MLLECHNCGAPLDVADGATAARCHYCGQESQVARFRTVAQQTPPDWSPPPAWTPPEGSSLPRVPLAYRPAAVVRTVFRGLWFAFVATICFGGFASWRVLSTIGRATGNAALSALDQSGTLKRTMNQTLSAMTGDLGDSIPVVCSGNQVATITGKNLSMPSGVPVIASGNCVLRLVACEISGTTAITARNNAHLTIEGGSVTGIGPAVVLSDNAELDVSGSARLSGETTVVATGNASARIHDSSVAGRHIAVHTSDNARVDTTGSTVHGAVSGRRR